MPTTTRSRPRHTYVVDESPTDEIVRHWQWVKPQVSAVVDRLVEMVVPQPSHYDRGLRRLTPHRRTPSRVSAEDQPGNRLEKSLN